jgi:hypothetical protein
MGRLHSSADVETSVPGLRNINLASMMGDFII